MDDKKKFGGTIRFKELMNELSEHVSDLSELVSRMIDNGLIALLEDDENLYKTLQDDLTLVHTIFDALDGSAMSSLALHQPFASDLRYIISSIKIGNEIHRCAHDAVHIAHSSEFVDRNKTMFNGCIKDIGELGKLALKMFHESTQAFINKKALDFKEWQKLDDKVDHLHEEIINDINSIMEKNPEWVRAGVSLILATRYIERIADHACNIVEESSYVVTSKRGKIE
ncbi:MAG: phosphate signaling complex protein PhoU [Candidatus Heimdallarchaeota archaeon]